MTKPMAPQPDPSPRYVRRTRYSTSALLRVVGILCLWAAFSPPWGTLGRSFWPCSLARLARGAARRLCGAIPSGAFRCRI